MTTDHIIYDQPTLDVEYDYVGIIDGLMPSERKDFGITDQLRSLLRAAGVTTALAEVGSAADLLGALTAFEHEASRGRRFMLHFVAHGNEHGIAAGAELVEWPTIRPFMRRLHAATNGALLLNMSTCKGLHGVKIVSGVGGYPFFGLIGAKDDLHVIDALEANKRVYTKWLSGTPVQTLVPETNLEMGRELLFNVSAEGFRKLSAEPSQDT